MKNVLVIILLTMEIIVFIIKTVEPQAMWLMLQRDEPEDYVIATGKVTSVRAFVEAAFKEVSVTGRDFKEVSVTGETSKSFVLENVFLWSLVLY